MRKTGALLLLLASALGLGCPSKGPTSPDSPIVWNPYNPANSVSSEAVNGSNGFYVHPYPGTSLYSVVMWMIVSQAGSYTYGLSCVDSTTSGPVGSASTGAVTLAANSLFYPVTFTFGGDPGVAKGDQVAFTVSVTNSPGGSTSSFCTQASNAGNTDIVATLGGNPQSTGVALVVNGNS